MNVATDVAIMALPIWMIKDLKVSMRQKLGLVFVFSIATVIVVLEIIRTIESLNLNIVLMVTLEINLAVIVSCLPTYRALLCLGQQRHPSRTTKYKKPPKVSWLRSISSGPTKVKSDNSDHSDTTQLTPESIYVTKGYKISSGKRDQFELKSMDTPSMEFRPSSPNVTETAIPPSNSNMV
ncbi:hypothetical protein MMC30_005139 [Trapelia coarctata]|nr:hypothetical protein [Trapelia coarctata]